MNPSYPHIAARLFNTPLLIHPGKLSAIVTGLASRFNVAPTPSAYITPTGTREKGGYTLLSNGIGIIDVFGPLAHRGGLQADSSYIQGYESLARTFSSAMEDDTVRALLLNIDSPGGEVAGAFQLAQKIHAARGRKPIAAIASDLAASAGYLIASAADTVSVTQTGVVGSIGIATCHADLSRALDKQGVAITCIYAGAHKMDGNPYGPLTPDVTAQIQADVDYCYSLFLETVAAYRPKNPVDALRATEAKTYIGPQAIAVGLADYIETPDQAIARLISRSSPSKRGPVAHKVNAMPPETEFETPDSADVPITEPTPAPAALEVPGPEAARPLDAVSIARACNSAREPGLTPILLATPHTQEQVDARIAQAAAVRRVCALAQAPELADGLIAAGADENAAMLATWQTLADRSNANPVDPTPPNRSASAMTRAQFEQLNPSARAEFIRAGGKLSD